VTRTAPPCSSCIHEQHSHARIGSQHVNFFVLSLLFSTFALNLLNFPPRNEQGGARRRPKR
jgi:hypothetical protein